MDYVISKIRIVRVELNIDLKAKEDNISPYDFYYGCLILSYSTFKNLPLESLRAGQ